MRTILRIQFGSHLYGTSTPASDFDFKSVFIPDARDILLGRAKGSISEKRPKAEGEKNYAGEVEEEAFSLQKYLQLLAQGRSRSQICQTIATEFSAPMTDIERDTDALLTALQDNGLILPQSTTPESPLS